MSVTHRFQRALVKAGLPRQRFHDLRHAAASIMIEAGIRMPTVMAILGHSSITVTVDTYSHTSDEAKRSAANALERALQLTA